MSGILNEAVERYLEGLLPVRSQTLLEMETLAKEEKIPIVGPMVGRILWQLARVHGAKRILEMGSSIGYSTIWLALGAGEGCKVIYTDWGEETADRARGFFEKAGVADRIDVRVGDALGINEYLEGPFDLVFNDVDKHFYPEVFRKALPLLRPGGLLVCDNVLWSGKVAEEGGDDWTQAIREYNRLCHETPGVFTSILPVRDGVAVSIKLPDDADEG